MTTRSAFICTACEGNPQAPNDPCAICGRSPKATFADSYPSTRWQINMSEAEMIALKELLCLGDWTNPAIKSLKYKIIDEDGFIDCDA